MKTLVIETGIKIAWATKPLDSYGIWEKILPWEEHYYQQFMMFENARQIFSKLGGLKDPETISSS